MNKKWSGWSLSSKWTLAYALLIILVSGTMTLGVYFQLVQAQRKALQERLHDIVSFAMPLMDGDYHSLIRSTADESGPFYDVLETRLLTIKNTTPIIKRIYTLRENQSGQIVYVVDINDSERHHVGDPYTISDPELGQGLSAITMPMAEINLFSDDSGTYLRGFAPIYDQFSVQDGVLVMEIDARSIIDSETSARRVAIIIFLAVVPLSLLAGWRLAKYFTSPVNDLVTATERVARGKLEEPVPVRSRDELGVLADTFNHMTNQLRQTMGGLEQEISKYQEAEKLQDAIFRISQAVISTNTIDDMYRSIHAILGELIPVDNFYIAIHDPITNIIDYPYFVDQYDPKPLPAEPSHGLTEYVMQSKMPILITTERFNELVASGEVDRVGTTPVDWLGAPLIVENRTLGVVVVQSYSKKIRFTQENLNLLEFISAQIALSIEHKWAAEMLQHSNERYRMLFENSPISLWEEDFSEVKRKIDKLLEASVKDLRSYISSHPEFIQACASSVNVVDVNQASLELFQATSKEEILQNLPIIFSESSYELFREELVQIANSRTAFNLEGKKRTLKNKHIDVNLRWSVVPGFEGDFSRVIVSIIDITEQRLAEKKLIYISSHDALTGLYNRAYFNEEMERLERSRQFPISVIMVDVDSLKKTNDQKGHAAGDVVLQETANVLNAVFRAEDVVARIGGDEFAILLPNSDDIGAQKAIGRIRAKIAKINESQDKSELSLSLGYSTAETRGKLSAALIDADTNMYADKYSKHKSKNTRTSVK